MVILCDFSLWLTSLSIPVSGAIHVVATGIILYCFMTQQDSGGEVYLLDFSFSF